MIAFCRSLLQETLAFTTINGASSTDATTFAGTSGADVIALVNQSNLYLYGAQSNDVVTATTFNGNYNGYTMNGGAGNDAYTIGTAAATNLITASSINGNTGNDTLTVTGILSGSTVAGGQGLDTIVINGATGSYVNGNKENDRIDLTTNAATATTIASSTIRGGQGGDLIRVGTGAAGALNISGNVYGDKGTDTFVQTNAVTAASEVTAAFNGGEDGDTFNFIVAGGSNIGFIMNGDEGNDTLNSTNSVTGGDTMTGGAGNDTFVAALLSSQVTSVATTDSITDFSNGTDVIGGLVWTAMTAANLATDQLAVTTALAGNAALTLAQAWAAADNRVVAGAAGTIAFSFGGNNYVGFSDTTDGFGAGDYITRVTNSINSAIGITATGNQINSIA